MRFRRRRDKRGVTGAALYLPRPLLREMVREARDHAPQETGGMLIGYRTSELADAEIVVTGLIGAGPEARRTRNRFEPDGPWQQEQLERIYAQSGRVTTYLGDWHSHPRGGTRLSAIDRATYQRVASDRKARAPHPLVLIIGLRRKPLIGAYTVDESRFRGLDVLRIN
jgi:integrative and conjugative element protein (TIGR02256 family)